MQNFLLLRSLLVLTTLTLAACASQAPKQAAGDKPAARGGEQNNTQVTTAADCLGTSPASSASLAQAGEQKIAGDRLTLLASDLRTRKTLCEVLRDSGKKVAIFQFAGVTCISCRDHAQYLERELKAGGHISAIAHVVVFTDFPEDYPDAERRFQEFLSINSPSALRAHDEKIQLWKYFSKDPAVPVFGTAVAMALNLDGAVVNEENQIDIILAAAKRLAGSR